jgi:3-oxoacyl-[acyl-carrier protein] reductase
MSESMREGPQLDGRVAIVTGGSRGIGRAIAAALLDHGAQVAISGRSGSSLADAETALRGGQRLLTVRADVSDESDVHQLVRTTVDRFGGIDILINNAGIGRMGEVSDQTTADWRLMIETNLTGVFFCCRAVIPHMKLREGGWIINISSLASQNPFAGGAAYSATKAGLNAFSHALMQEVRQAGIRVSVVLPGSVDTRFSDRDTGPTDWKLSPDDVARTVIDLLGHPGRSLPSRVELRPSRPKS